MRHLAPAGTPIGLRDISFWVQTLFSTRAAIDNFKNTLCEQFGLQSCFFLSTGRAAMTFLLQCMKMLVTPEKDSVIIPSYTCYSVASSVIKAGLHIKVCEINANTLDYDFAKLDSIDFSRVLAIVSSNLYGIPNDLEQIEKIAKQKNIFFIDDAAQCMGARASSGRQAGVFGDAGIFSLDKGKVITSMNGGILVTRSPLITSAILKNIDTIPSPSAIWCAKEVIKAMIYTVFLRPSLYWIPAALPFLHLGDTLFTTDYPIEHYNRWLCGMAHHLFNRMDDINSIRRKNGLYYQNNLPASPHLKHIALQPDGEPIFIRYPIRITDRSLRHNVIKTLSASGLGVSGSFPKAIVDIDHICEILKVEGVEESQGKLVADQIVTLPTHPFVTGADQDRIITLIANMLR